MLSQTQSIPEILKALLYFRNLSDAQCGQLAEICSARTYPAGDLIFAQGDKAERFYIIVSGRVQIYKLSAEGKEMILHLFGPGDMFAEVPIFSGFPRYPANSLCMEETRVLAIEGDGFRQLIANSSDMALSLLTVFAQRLHKFSGIIEDLALRTVDSRLAKYLLSVSENSPNKAVIQIHKKTLSAILGTVPETLSRSFKKLSEQGLITVEDNQIYILGREALAGVAGVDSP